MSDSLSTPANNLLEEELVQARRKIATDSYPMSIGELTNLYREDELVIRPAFQRLFRWDDEQKSQLIESILLGIPLPSIFVSQDESGRWELIDGLQRVSTILQLQGLLKDEKFPALVLSSTKYLKHLEGKVWKEGSDFSLTEAQRLDVKRAKLDIKIVKRDSDDETKYDLFQRLNSFGTSLSAQEIRNAILVGVNAEFAEWLHKLAQYESFVETTSLPDKDVAAKYDEDLVLRFLWLHALPDPSTAALRQFQVKLEEEALEMAKHHDANKDRLEDVFKETFDAIAAHGGARIFRKWNNDKQRFQGGFLNTAYEVFAMGVGYRVANGLAYRRDFVPAARELWAQGDMTSRFATGKATEQRLALMLPKGRALVDPS